MLLTITRRGVTRTVCKVGPGTYRTLAEALADAWTDSTYRAPFMLDAIVATAERLALGGNLP